MRREHNNSTQTPIESPTVLCDVRVVDGAVIDTVTGINRNNTNIKVNGNYFYTTYSSRSIGFVTVVNNAWQSVYTNKKGNWQGSTPNPPTNGVSPNYFGGKLRLVCEAYYPSFRSGKSLFSTMSHNNSAYRGITIRLGTTDGNFTFGEMYSNYNAWSYSQDFTFENISETNPYILQFDFTEDQYRLKMMTKDGTVKFDSGVRNCLTSGRQAPIMLCSYDGSNRAILQYVKYFTYYDGDTCSDFLS